MRGSSRCDFKLAVLLAEAEIVCDRGSEAGGRKGVEPGSLQALESSNAAMEPERNRFRQPFVESGAFLHGCNSSATLAQLPGRLQQQHQRVCEQLQALLGGPGLDPSPLMTCPPPL